jgi:hypothetical protein
MDAKTARDSLVKRDAEWLVAGQMTQQFLTELEEHYVEAEEGILEKDTVNYNSIIDLNSYASVNFDVD